MGEVRADDSHSSLDSRSTDTTAQPGVASDGASLTDDFGAFDSATTPDLPQVSMPPPVPKVALGGQAQGPTTAKPRPGARHGRTLNPPPPANSQGAPVPPLGVPGVPVATVPRGAHAVPLATDSGEYDAVEVEYESEDESGVGLPESLTRPVGQISEPAQQMPVGLLRQELAELRQALVVQTREIQSLRDELVQRDARFFAMAAQLREDVVKFSQQAAAAPRATVSEGDPLREIRGIGPKLAKSMREAGVTSLEQIAAWGQEDIARVAQEIGIRASRIERDGWVQAAKRLTSGQ